MIQIREAKISLVEHGSTKFSVFLAKSNAEQIFSFKYFYDNIEVTSVWVPDHFVEDPDPRSKNVQLIIFSDYYGRGKKMIFE